MIEADDSEAVTVSSEKDASAAMNAAFRAMSTSARPGDSPERLLEAANGAMPVAAQGFESPKSMEEQSAAAMDAANRRGVLRGV
jgi:hypothetical protein